MIIMIVILEINIILSMWEVKLQMQKIMEVIWKEQSEVPGIKSVNY